MRAMQSNLKSLQPWGGFANCSAPDINVCGKSRLSLMYDAYLWHNLWSARQTRPQRPFWASKLMLYLIQHN